MFKGLFTLARPALLAFEAEKAHEMTLRSLEKGLFPRQDDRDDPLLRQTVWGLDFRNPLGMAAGFDKNGRVIAPLFKMGFGFTEAGTVTPLPQSGNPSPRVFRAINDRAVINRLGFNNEGHEALARRLAQRSHDGVLGVNLGANKDSDDRIGDYVQGLVRFYELTDYFTINISSPNTPGLRNLQAPEELDALLSRLTAARAAYMDENDAPSRPLVVKLAPDIHQEDLAAVCERLAAHQVDGVAVSNTTLSRAGLSDAATAAQQGGLSGQPLFHRATCMLARVHQLTNGAIPLIGVGGIDSGAAAVVKIEAGASLIQLYTGMIYEGPSLIPRIKAALLSHLRDNGCQSLNEAVGRKAEEWAARDIESEN